MKSMKISLHRAVTALLGSLAMASLSPAWAGRLDAFVFEGTGNLIVFDAASGSGGWNGAITEFTDPARPGLAPLSFASLVLFDFDPALNRLTGQFEFSDAVDLASSVFGTLSGAFTDPGDTLDGGGQFALDYQITGGTGAYDGQRGFGLSFLSFDPNATGFDNYSEQGLLAAVPEPSTWALLALGLGALGLRSRHRAG